MASQDIAYDSAASPASSSSSSSSDITRPDSPTTLFEDSLFTLFSHNQPAHGDPGDLCKYTHPNLPPRYLPSSSSASPTRPATLRYKIAQNSGTNTKLFAHHQWDAGLYLADLIAEQSVGEKGKAKENFVDVRGRTVVELGAGTGLPGLVAALMGAKQTVITDYPDPHVIDNLERNLDLALLPSNSKRRPNPHYQQARKNVRVAGLGWGNASEEASVLTAADTGYDLVLAADVLWVSSAHPLLIQTMRKLLKRDRNARCALIAGFHTGRPAVRRFFVQLAQPAEDGTLEEGRKGAIVADWEEAEFGGIWERNIDGSRRAWIGARLPRKGDDPKRWKEDGEGEGMEEEMGDISDRGSWIVVASLRWADLE